MSFRWLCNYAETRKIVSSQTQPRWTAIGVVRSGYTATITNEGVEDTEEHEWEDDSACQCRACGHSATVINFIIVENCLPGDENGGRERIGLDEFLEELESA